jgi:hypothetical protein
MVKIINIRKQPGTYENQHLAIVLFRWVNEQTQVTGQTDPLGMYDWMVNKKGQAYIRSDQGNTIYVFARTSSTGQPYLQAAKDGVWTDDLLNVPVF